MQQPQAHGLVTLILLELSEAIHVMELAQIGDDEAMLAVEQALGEEESAAFAERAAAAKRAADDLKDAVMVNLGLELGEGIPYGIQELEEKERVMKIELAQLESRLGGNAPELQQDSTPLFKRVAMAREMVAAADSLEYEKCKQWVEAEQSNRLMIVELLEYGLEKEVVYSLTESQLEEQFAVVFEPEVSAKLDQIQHLYSALKLPQRKQRTDPQGPRSRVTMEVLSQVRAELDRLVDIQDALNLALKSTSTSPSKLPNCAMAPTKPKALDEPGLAPPSRPMKKMQKKRGQINVIC